MTTVRKAIIPAAGYGTRFLPVTKAVPKEMLPIVDTPSIDYVVEECVQAGITDICILLGRGKECIPNHFDRNFELESALIKSGKRLEVKLLNKYLGKVSFTFIRQPEMKGTGKAVELCKTFVGSEPFAVLFGDDVMSSSVPVIGQLIKAHSLTNATVVGVQKLPKEEAVNYGVVVPGGIKGRYVELLGFKEKPKIDEIPSTYTSLGRFVLTPDIFSAIEITPPNEQNGEVYLPTAIDILSKSTAVYAYEFEGRRYDIGSKEGYIQANIEFALRDEKLKNGIVKYLEELASKGYKV